MMDLKKILKNRSKILEGVTNTLFKKQFVEDVAAQRIEICAECEHMGDKCEVPGTGPCCNICGCSLKYKVRSLSSNCGLEEINETLKWEAVMSDEEESKYMEDIDNDDR